MNMLKEHNHEMKSLDSDINNVFKLLLLNKLNNKETALLDIHYDCLELVSNSLDTEYVSDIETLCELMIDIGMELSTIFEKLNLYIDNTLPYKFNSLLNEDLLLEKIND